MRFITLLVSTILSSSAFGSSPKCLDLFSAGNRSSQDIVSQIAHLPEHSRVPRTILNQTDPKILAEAIANRARSKSSAQTTHGPLVDMAKDAEIHIYFNASDLDSIFRDGFLNQHQTGVHSNGDYDPETRTQVESALASLDLNNPSRKEAQLLPKYGAIDVHGGPNSGLVQEGDWNRYGDISVVLKNDVKKRTTWSRNDSLDSWQVEPSSLLETVHLPQGSTRYLEAQVWGPIDLRDVEEFRVPRNISASVLEVLKLTGIPVYYFGEGSSDGLQKRPRAELALSASESMKLKLDANKGRVSSETIEQALEVTLSEFIERTKAIELGQRFFTPMGLHFKVQTVSNLGEGLLLLKVENSQNGYWHKMYVRTGSSMLGMAKFMMLKIKIRKEEVLEQGNRFVILR